MKSSSLLIAGIGFFLAALSSHARLVTIEVHDMISSSDTEVYLDKKGDQLIRFKDPTYAGYPLPSISNSQKNETLFCEKMGYKFAGAVPRTKTSNDDTTQILVYDLQQGKGPGYVRYSHTPGIAEINCRK